MDEQVEQPAPKPKRPPPIKYHSIHQSRLATFLLQRLTPAEYDDLKTGKMPCISSRKRYEGIEKEFFQVSRELEAAGSYSQADIDAALELEQAALHRRLLEAARSFAYRTTVFGSCARRPARTAGDRARELLPILQAFRLLIWAGPDTSAECHDGFPMYSYAPASLFHRCS